MFERRIGTMHTYVYHILRDISSWDVKVKPLFRGEPNEKNTPLLPSLYRKKPDGTKHDENFLVQEFRRMAPAIGAGITPNRQETDLWLFLMQHVRLPTRLLDWTEGALIGLYFALEYKKPVVWMLDWSGLNRLSTGGKIADKMSSLTWFDPPGIDNPANPNVKAAWENGATPFPYPVAIKPTYIHPRMNAQKSWFTAQGYEDKPIVNLVPPSILKKYVIMPSRREKMKSDLAMLGVTYSNLFPDLEGLALELQEVD
jgi:hypothetical protein